MQQHPLRLFVFLGLFAIMGSCNLVEIQETTENSKDPESLVQGPRAVEATNVQTFASHLHGEVSKTWANVSFEMDGIEGMLSCREDDSITLYADGTYSYDGGDNLCGGEDIHQTRIGTYQIDFENKELIFDGGTSLEATASVVGLTSTETVLSGSYLLLGVRGHYKSE